MWSEKCPAYPASVWLVDAIAPPAPGKPTDNPFIESFNGSFRDECLNLNWFLSLDDAQQKIEAWRVDYNEYRPHQSLNDKTSQELITEHQQAEFF